MSESLDRELERHFHGQTNEQLARSIERSADFGADDEEYELTRRLNLVGMAWKYSQKYGADVVVIYEPENENEVRGYD